MGSRARKLILYTDGASRGNPGPASIGVVIKDEAGELVWEKGETLGTQTNNYAEYSALIRGLEKLAALGAHEIEIRTDSELMVRQIKGIYKVKNPGLKPLHEKALHLLKRFKHADIRHVRREENTEADAMANQALDGEL